MFDLNVDQRLIPVHRRPPNIVVNRGLLSKLLAALGLYALSRDCPSCWNLANMANMATRGSGNRAVKMTRSSQLLTFEISENSNRNTEPTRARVK
jgi:hypothetical protein